MRRMPSMWEREQQCCQRSMTCFKLVQSWNRRVPEQDITLGAVRIFLAFATNDKGCLYDVIGLLPNVRASNGLTGEIWAGFLNLIGWET